MPAALWQPVTDRVDAAACSPPRLLFWGGRNSRCLAPATMAEPGRCTDLVLLFFQLVFMYSQRYDILDFPKIQSTDSTKKMVWTVWNRSGQVTSPSVSLLCSVSWVTGLCVCLTEGGAGMRAHRAERRGREQGCADVRAYLCVVYTIAANRKATFWLIWFSSLLSLTLTL